MPHIALDRDLAKQIFGARDPDVLRSLIEGLLADEAGPPRCDLDGCWEAVHRTLGDGTISDEQEYPLGCAVLGNRLLEAGDAWRVSVVRPDTTAHLADALPKLDEQALRQRWERIAEDYQGPSGDETLAEVKRKVGELADFYASAAAARSAVVVVLPRT